MNARFDIGDDPADALTPMEVRTLVVVVLDLADDFGFDCAVAVVDRAGAIRGAERPGTVPVARLDAAFEAARIVLRDGGEAEAPAADGGVAGAVALGNGEVRGALAVSGGPDGFALEACREAARAVGLRRAA